MELGQTEAAAPRFHHPSENDPLKEGFLARFSFENFDMTDPKLAQTFPRFK